MKRTSLTVLLLLTLSSCAWDGKYRYPCQDPANWKAPECQPPLCDASGTCTKDLIDAPVSTPAP